MSEVEESIPTVKSLVDEIDRIFTKKCEWAERKEQLFNALKKVDFSTTESNKYTFFDAEKPYTRNLVATDHKNYTLLLLCWNPGKESKIHNHPCDGCFIKALAGCIKETKFSVDAKTTSISLSGVKFFCENQVSYMSDDIGLHKIGNPNKDIGAVTLHLYTPPFSVCKVRVSSPFIIRCLSDPLVHRFGPTAVKDNIPNMKKAKWDISVCMGIALPT
jgi:cysteine dioxygenase